jgi:hypothetical protein
VSTVKMLGSRILFALRIFGPRMNKDRILEETDNEELL